LDEESFAPSQRQYATRADEGYVAFAPPALPPDLLLDDGTIAALSAADRAIGELAGAGRTLPNPELLAGVLVRREAVLSSRIEGTQASLSELALFEAEEVRRPASDVNEVLNYVAAVQHVLDPNRALPLSLRLLREAHEVLLSGVRGGHATPGEFRRSQSWIGAPGCTLIDATYVPPPPEACGGVWTPSRSFCTVSGSGLPSSTSRASTTNSRRFTPSWTATGASDVCSAYF